MVHIRGLVLSLNALSMSAETPKKHLNTQSRSVFTRLKKDCELADSNDRLVRPQCQHISLHIRTILVILELGQHRVLEQV